MTVVDTVGSVAHPSATCADAHALWSRLPAGTAEAFAPHVRPLTDEILREITRTVPEYAAPSSVMANVIVAGVTRAVDRCLSAASGQPDAASPAFVRDWQEAFRRIGHTEFTEGRSLDALQSAYRVAGRTGWRYFAEFGRRVGMAPDLLCVSAEAIFATIDELSALAVDGFAEAEAAAGSTRRRERARLLALLLADPPAPRHAVDVSAAAAGWVVPASVVVVALDPAVDDTRVLVHDDVLADLDGAHPVLVVAARGRHLAGLGARLRGRRAAVSPPTPIAQVAAAATCARRTLALVRAGRLPDRPVTDSSRHLLTLLVTADDYVVARLRDRLLPRFADLPARDRDRLETTLLAWLQCGGNAIIVAERLGLHPQTVRQRIRRAHGLLGEDLLDPETRLELMLLLRADANGPR